MILKNKSYNLEQNHKYLEINQLNHSHLETNRKYLGKIHKHLEPIHYYLEMS